MANEKRRELIDRNAFFGIFDQDACKNLGDYGIGVLDVLMDLSNFRTVDAVEVVHGEWLVEAYTADDSIVVIPYRKHQHNDPFCSRCGHLALLNCGDYVTSNYCPNCGAKMDGGNEE